MNSSYLPHVSHLLGPARLSTLCWLVAVCGLLNVSRADDLRPLTPLDVAQLRVVSSAHPSPDGLGIGRPNPEGQKESCHRAEEPDDPPHLPVVWR